MTSTVASHSMQFETATFDTECGGELKCDTVLLLFRCFLVRLHDSFHDMGKTPKLIELIKVPTNISIVVNCTHLNWNLNTKWFFESAFFIHFGALKPKCLSILNTIFGLNIYDYYQLFLLLLLHVFKIGFASLTLFHKYVLIFRIGQEAGLGPERCESPVGPFCPLLLLACRRLCHAFPLSRAFQQIQRSPCSPRSLSTSIISYLSVSYQ